MIKTEDFNPKEKVSWLIFIPAIASLIPFVGVPFAISALLWGIADWRVGGRKAVTLASLGFLVTMLSGLYFYSTVGKLLNSPAYEDILRGNSQTSLSHLVRYIEYYRLGHGYYPSSLNDLKEKDINFKEPAFIDPITTAAGIPTGGP